MCICIFQTEEIDMYFFCKGEKNRRTISVKDFMLLFPAVHLGTF